MNQGEKGNCAYLVQSGSVEVFSQKDGQKFVLANLELGQIFGEMALIFDEVRSASVVAKEDCNLIVISRDAFKKKLDQSDPTIRAIVSMLTQRIVSANNAMMSKKETVDDLIATTRIIYDNLGATLEPKQRQTLENTVLPKLEALHESLSEFQERLNQK